MGDAFTSKAATLIQSHARKRNAVSEKKKKTMLLSPKPPPFPSSMRLMMDDPALEWVDLAVGSGFTALAPRGVGVQLVTTEGVSCAQIEQREEPFFPTIWVALEDQFITFPQAVKISKHGVTQYEKVDSPNLHDGWMCWCRAADGRYAIHGMKQCGGTSVAILSQFFGPSQAGFVTAVSQALNLIISLRPMNPEVSRRATSLQKALAEFDADSSGTLRASEFKAILTRQTGQAKPISDAQAGKWMKTFTGGKDHVEIHAFLQAWKGAFL